ncbi:MAG: hypothetical protein OXE94_09960 [Aestuariivita sp.]|nr:hypothetical protein [Aestuariivita sp.]MCY4203400.1 hypothetical protein [Aestuariivita sp.]
MAPRSALNCDYSPRKVYPPLAKQVNPQNESISATVRSKLSVVWLTKIANGATGITEFTYLGRMVAEIRTLNMKYDPEKTEREARSTFLILLRIGGRFL